LNEEKNIKPCLDSILNQEYPPSSYEIIVVDGGSTDRTQSVVMEMERAYDIVRLIVELKKGTAAGRNAGVKAARYNYVAFIDADCEAPRDWLPTLINYYRKAKQKDSKIIAVGGANIPPDNAGMFLKAIGIALDSYLGSFSSVQGRQFKKPIYVSSLSNLNVLYDKQKIVEIGYYDESLGSEAEDADINFRLNAAGYQMLFAPDSFVWHKMRPTPMTWMKNMFRYGKGRARLLKRYQEMWTVHYVLPLLFIVAMFSIFLISLTNIFLLSLLYFPVIFLYSLFQCIRKKSFALTLHVMYVYLIQHFGYAAGEVYGLLNPNVR